MDGGRRPLPALLDFAAMAAARRRFAFLLVLLLTLAAIELGAQTLLLPRMRPRPPFGRSEIQRTWAERTASEIAAGYETPGVNRFDPELGWTTRPGFVSDDGRVHVNARGLRGRGEHDDAPPRGMRRVVAAGGSFTFGDEVADHETWPARLDSLFTDAEVWNLGVGGYGTDQALLRLERDGRAPVDAVVVGMLLENIGRNVNRYRPLWFPGSQPAAKPRFLPRGDSLVLVPQPFATRGELVEAVRSGAVFARLAQHEHWNARYLPVWLEWSAVARIVAGRRAYQDREPKRIWSDSAGEPFRTTLATLAAFRPAGARLGASRTLVLVLPAREDLRGLVERGDRYWAPLLDTLRARGIETIDVAEVLAPMARELGVDSLYRVGHFGPRANDLIARAVAERLAATRPRGSSSR